MAKIMILRFLMGLLTLILTASKPYLKPQLLAENIHYYPPLSHIPGGGAFSTGFEVWHDKNVCYT
jgi:hypothetical protein